MKSKIFLGTIFIALLAVLVILAGCTAVSQAKGPTCGDGLCEAGESDSTNAFYCPADCPIVAGVSYERELPAVPGELSVIVLERGGDPDDIISNAKVTVRNTANNETVYKYTGTDGKALFSLEAGTYNITITKEGYKEKEITETIASNQTISKKTPLTKETQPAEPTPQPEEEIPDSEEETLHKIGLEVFSQQEKQISRHTITHTMPATQETLEINETITSGKMPGLVYGYGSFMYNSSPFDCKTVQEKLELKATINKKREIEIFAGDMAYVTDAGLGIPIYEKPGSTESFTDGPEDLIGLPLMGEIYLVKSISVSNSKASQVELVKAEEKTYFEGDKIEGLLGKDGEEYYILIGNVVDYDTIKKINLSLYDAQGNKAASDIKVTYREDAVFYNDNGEAILDSIVVLTAMLEATKNNESTYQVLSLVGTDRVLLKNNNGYPYDPALTPADYSYWVEMETTDGNALTKIIIETRSKKQRIGSNALKIGESIKFPDERFTLTFKGWKEETAGLPEEFEPPAEQKCPLGEYWNGTECVQPTEPKPEQPTDTEDYAYCNSPKVDVTNDGSIDEEDYEQFAAAFLSKEHEERFDFDNDNYVTVHDAVCYTKPIFNRDTYSYLTYESTYNKPRNFIEISPNKRFFQFEDGTAFIPVGINVWDPAIAFLDNGVDETELRPYFQYLKEHGINTVRIMPSQPPSRQGYLVYQLEPLVGYIEEQTAQWYDRFFDIAEEEGIYIMITPWRNDEGFSSGNPGLHPYAKNNGGSCKGGHAPCLEAGLNREYQKNLLRYFIDRWGNRNNLFAFEISNELNFPPHGNAPTEVQHNWLTEIGKFVREYSEQKWGKAHIQLVSTSAPYTLSYQINNPENQINTIHSYSYYWDENFNHYDVFKSGIVGAWRANNPKPFISNEQGPLGQVSINPWLDALMEKTRDWTHLAAGGSGTTFRWPGVQYKQEGIEVHHTYPLYHPEEEEHYYKNDKGVEWNGVNEQMLDNYLAISKFVSYIDWSKITTNYKNIDDYVAHAADLEVYAASDKKTTIGWIVRPKEIVPQEINFITDPILDTKEPELIDVDGKTYEIRFVSEQSDKSFNMEINGKTYRIDTRNPYYDGKIYIAKPDAWKDYLFYVKIPNPESYEITITNLSDGEHKMTWVDTSTGDKIGTDDFTGTAFTVATPEFYSDIAFYIETQE